MTHSPPYDAGAGDFDDPNGDHLRETGPQEPRHDGRDAPDRPLPDEADEEADDARSRAAELAELRRYEAEREDKRRRRDSASRKAVAWIVAVALAFLLYDSGGALARGTSEDGPWTAHAVLAGLAALGLLGLLVAGIRALRRR
ncbi:hypothetical protein SAMN04489712_13324 [Thermomonospora echinospora]|uniref:Uncharacterized protein n=1 Tax=Thermomonospora echinospora TaxID=1992 RepID=A0A1H6E3X3_9ACTN|nr:hypothetical protein [Thermomonospora echinospora]SEG92350.1 hypothetical protein SAMN04489712_13324 [Thermomonospora echinospora]